MESRGLSDLDRSRVLQAENDAPPHQGGWLSRHALDAWPTLSVVNHFCISTAAAASSDAVGVVVGHISGDIDCRRGVEHSTDMEMDLDSRNSALVVGEELNDSVEIPGYEHHSTWGYDLNTRSYWASLWPNDGDRDAPPTASVGWSGPTLPRPDCVLVELCTQLRHDPLTVARGLGLMVPIHPRTPEQLATRHLDVFEPGVVDGYTLVGSWLVGDADRCPASGWPCYPGFVPAAEHLWAEVLYATGRRYLGERTSLLASLDEALCYAAGLARD